MRRIALAIALAIAPSAPAFAQLVAGPNTNVAGGPACSKAGDARCPFQVFGDRAAQDSSVPGAQHDRKTFVLATAANVSSSFGVGLTCLMRAGLSPSCTEAGCIPAAGSCCADLGGDQQ
jgi:hypothetical protein